MAAKSKKPLQPMNLPAAATPLARPAAAASAPAPMSPAPLAPFAATVSYEAFAELGREAITAAVKSNAAVSAGMEAMGQELMVYARDALQTASETARGLLGAKTMEDVIRLQTDLARRNFEGLVAGSAKLQALGVTLATEALAPWEGRVEAAMTQLLPAYGKFPAA